MAERNPRIPHSVQSLLYVERRGKYCGYKLELISDTISSDLKEFLICSECKGISRMARQVGANTVCEVCVTVRERYVDEKVENKVKSLNSKCPLTENGCSWLGVIEEHMLVCSKLVIQCHLECGMAFERENTEEHNKEECPLRIIECQYCRIEIQVREENYHIGECTNHPDTEIACPYKELGCDEIVLRKNKDIHLAENTIGHQKLMLNQLSQLRNRNRQLEQLNEEQKNKNLQQEMVSNQLERVNKEQERVNKQHKDRIGIIEASETNKKGKDNRTRKVWVIIELVLAGIAVVLAAIIGISVATSFANGIQYNLEQIQGNSEQTNSNLQKIEANSRETNSNLQKIQANSQQTNSNLQKIEANLRETNSNSEQIQSNSRKTNSNLLKIQSNLRETNSYSEQIEANSRETNSNLEQIQAIKESTSHISEYKSERGKVLPGIEWIHGFEETGSIYGPSFYLKRCNLRLKANVYSHGAAFYYIERLNGKNDNSISSCTISYIYFTYGYTNEIEPINDDSSATNRILTVGHSSSSYFYYRYWGSSSREVIIRAYFDAEVD